MRSLPLLALSVVLLPLPIAPAVAAPRTIEVASKISAVTVYPDRAQITRTTEVELAPGTYQIQFTRLPVDLDADSVRVRGEGTAATTLHGFELKTRFLGESPDKEVATLETRLTAFDDQLKALADEEAIHQRQLALLTTTAQQAGDSLARQLGAGKAKLAEWQQLLTFLQSQQSKEAGAIRGIQQKRRGLQAQRKKVTEALAKLRGFRRQQVRQIPVTVEITRSGTLELELDYVIPGARWSPAYDARLNAGGDKLDWRYYGVVSQQTGEDWNDVRLKLSTARPSVGNRRPDVPGWFLSLWQPEPQRKSARRSKDDSYMGGAPGAKAAPKPAAPPPAEREEARDADAVVADEGTSVTLEVPRAVTIPADGEEHQTPIGRKAFAAKSAYYAMPRVSPFAFLEVEVKNEGPWPLLPGPVKAFVGKDYVGTTPLEDDIVGDETFKLPMGVDRAIRIERQRLAKQEGEAGLLQKVQFADYHYEVELANFKKTAQTLTLVEPVPQTTDEAVKVKLADMNYPAQSAKDPGRVTWSFNLKPSEKKVLRWGYRVEYPVGAQITGLE